MNNLLTPSAVSAVNHRPHVEALDLAPSSEQVRAEAVAALSAPQKALPCRLFYDECGSRLFDQICDLPEYYPTRTELRIMRDYAGEIAMAIGAQALVVEYGSGSSLKTRVLLDHLPDVAAYIPIDICREHLRDAADALRERYWGLPVLPVCADYTQPLTLPAIQMADSKRTVAYFPGSTIGNMDPSTAIGFLRSIRATCGQDSKLLIGVDLKKDPATIHAAYNDADGVTAAFNLNVLRRLNRECGSNFDLGAFCHYAFFNPALGRVEMHLVSLEQQAVTFPGSGMIPFDEGETIHTESCYKYTPQEFADLAAFAGYRCENAWLDERNLFSVLLFEGTP
jgi:dimethylhistidine N-methyltransferase